MEDEENHRRGVNGDYSEVVPHWKEGRTTPSKAGHRKKKKIRHSCASSFWRDQALISEHGSLHGSAGP